MSFMNQEDCYRFVIALAHFLWLGCIPVVLWAVAMRLAPRRAVQLRYTISVAAMAGMVAMLAVAFTFVPKKSVSSASSGSSALQTVSLVDGAMSKPDSSPGTTAPPKSVVTDAGLSLIAANELSTETYASTEIPQKEGRAWATYLTIAYFLGLAICTIRLFSGLRVVCRLRRQSQHVAQPELKQLVSRIAAEIALKSEPAVLWCEKTLIPSVVGVLRPVVLLPAAYANGISIDQFEHVLRHEFTHLKRCDHIVNFLQSVVETILFFHPLVWFMSSQIRLQREICCDASLMESGVDAKSYINTLIDVAVGASRAKASPHAFVVGATSSKSHLRQRIERMMGQTEASPRKRRLLVEGSGMAIVAIALAMICMVTILRNEPKSQTESIPAPAQEPETTNPQDSKVELQLPENIGPLELAGVVTDESGKPLEGVTVDVWSYYKGDEAQTDKNGVFRFKPSSDGGRRRVEVRFMKEGYSPHYVAQQPVGQKGLVIKLNQDTFIEGRVVGTDGKPVAGLTVRGEQRNIRADGVFIGEVPTETETDTKGNYRLYVHPDEYFLRIADKSGVATIDNIHVKSGDHVKQDIELTEGVHFQATVVDANSGKPFEGLVLFSWKQNNLKAISDKEGKLSLLGLPPGKMTLNVGAGKLQKKGGTEFYRHGPLGRWWSPDATGIDENKTIEDNGWQRNFDDFEFEMQLGMKPVQIFVEQGVVFSGHVYDPNGKPRAGATVAAARTGSGNSLTGDTRYSVKTEEDGSYRAVMPASNDFEYNLIVHDGTYRNLREFAGAVTRPMRTRPGQKVRGLDFKLKQPATVMGKVTAPKGVDLSKRRVRAHAADLLGNRYYDPTVNVKADGTFELTGLRPGKHYIQVDPFWLNAAQGPPQSSALVEVTEGETVEDIELKAAATE